MSPTDPQSDLEINPPLMARPARGPAARESAMSDRKTEDTALGCRERAEASLVAAAAMDTVNGRERMELSAASWTTRADLLARLEASQSARRERESDGESRPPMMA